MKRYFWLGLVVVFLGVCSALVWHAGADSCGTRDGMSGRTIGAESLSNWNKGNPDMLVEANGKELYLQEAIGSTGASLTSPQELKNNFIITFELKSLTRKATISFKTVEADQTANYTFEINQQPHLTKVQLNRGAQQLQQTMIAELQPDQYYEIELIKQGRLLKFLIAGKMVAQVQDAYPLAGGRLVFAISGEPDHPAGITLKNFRLYQ